MSRRLAYDQYERDNFPSVRVHSWKNSRPCETDWERKSDIDLNTPVHEERQSLGTLNLAIDRIYDELTEQF
jgi:hypothetical protein